ncbi:MAG: cation:proton antiporter [Gemmatimonadales bacterium]|jgi:Kef-type K+ transport system membrane component KefB
MDIGRIAGVTAALLTAAPATAWASSASGEGNSLIVNLFLIFGVMLLAGKFSGELFERIGQPAVLGELIAGILLGASVLGVIPTAPEEPLTEVVRIFAEIGVVILLFEIGLETDLKQMFRVGPAATSVAMVGVILPMVAGLLFWISPLGDPELTHASATTTGIFLGGTLTATSVGITARVLQDLRVMHSVEARLIIGAAVIDDILGIIILGMVSSLVAGAAISLLGIGKSVLLAVGFLVVAVAIGLAAAPKVFGLLDRMRVRGILLVAAFAFAMFMAAAADLAGSAMIIGAFGAGIVLSGTNQFDTINDRIKPVADIFTPVFFLSIGAQFDVSLLNPFVGSNLTVLGVGGALFVIAIIGKVIAGWAVPWLRFNRLGVGIGMVPRGEVGLIFANIGLVEGVLTRELFSAILIMVMGTTFIAPPLLKWGFGRWGVTDPSDARRGPLPERLKHAAQPDGDAED